MIRFHFQELLIANFTCYLIITVELLGVNKHYNAFHLFVIFIHKSINLIQKYTITI